MKTSTKILTIITIVLLIPNIFLFRYLASSIVATEDGFVFNFSILGYVALGFLIAFLISFTILYIIFLRSLSLSNQLFFSIVPLSIIYGLFAVYISQIGNMNDITSQSVRTTLNIDTGENFNALLWILFATILYLVLLFVLIIFACKPLKNVEKITQKLGDGRAKFDDFKVGGNKQFQEIEHSLNKINYIYKEKDNLIFKIQDFAGGLPSTVKSKLFKEMVTTKGKNGTGLGLFMSYSNIRAHFNGDIRFDSRKGKGTTFYIEIPYGGRRTEVGSWKIGIRK